MHEPMLMEIPAESIKPNESQQAEIEELVEAITLDGVVVFDVLSQPVKEMYLKVGGITEIMTRQNPGTAQGYLMGFLVGLEVGNILFSRQDELSDVVQMVYNRSIGVPEPQGTKPPSPTLESRYAEANEIINLERSGLGLHASLSIVAEKIACVLTQDEMEQPVVKGSFGLGLSVSYMADRLPMQTGDWNSALRELNTGNL